MVKHIQVHIGTFQDVKVDLGLFKCQSKDLNAMAYGTIKPR